MELARVELSVREVEVLASVATGLTSKEVAVRLALAKCTVDYHLENIYRKLGATNKMQAVRLAMQLGLLPSYPELPIVQPYMHSRLTTESR